MLAQQRFLPLNQQIRSSLKQYFANFESFELKQITNLYNLVLAEVERPLLDMVLEYTQGNQSQAAKVLGLSRNTLRKLLENYKIIE